MTVRFSTKKSFALLLLLLLVPATAHAQCENPAAATASMQALMMAETMHINQYTRQEINFLDKDLKETATKEVMDRFDQFRNNILDALNSYAERLIPEMRDMSKQLSTFEVDQTRQLGSFDDARLQNDTLRRQGALRAQVKRESSPSTSACVVDSLGPAQSRGYRIGRAVARALAHDALQEQAGAGAVGARGSAAMVTAVEADFQDKFCDLGNGDQGCLKEGPLAGRNNDLSSLLWEDRQTIDLSTPENKAILETVVRNIAGPLPPNPIARQDVRSAKGFQEKMRRRAERARLNTIYNAIGQMTGQHVGGTGANVQDIRAGAGASGENASTDASYSEINRAVTRDRFSDPRYLFNMVNDPAGLVREQGALNAMRLMTISDLYKRTEEMVWIEGSVLGAMLDARMP